MRVLYVLVYCPQGLKPSRCICLCDGRSPVNVGGKRNLEGLLLFATYHNQTPSHLEWTKSRRQGKMATLPHSIPITPGPRTLRGHLLSQPTSS